MDEPRLRHIATCVLLKYKKGRNPIEEIFLGEARFVSTGVFWAFLSHCPYLKGKQIPSIPTYFHQHLTLFSHYILLFHFPLIIITHFQHQDILLP